MDNCQTIIQYANGQCPPPPPPPPDGFHHLPFTGGDVILFVLVGILIIACGVILRWRAS